jgi:magnesium-transporting ATPase (P-type)
MGAVLASDYALPEFRMLWRLLLVHGRWNYIRISEMILYFFYKNMLFTIPQFIFAFYCGFSGQTIFDDVYISLYNLFFTSFPLVVRAILEQDVYYVQPAREELVGEESMNEIVRVKQNHVMATQQAKFVPHQYEMNKYLYRLFPKIYFIGQENCIFNYANFFMWTLEGMLEAVLISLFTIYILGTSSISQSGYNSDLWLTSLTMYLPHHSVSPQSSSSSPSNCPRTPSSGQSCSSSPSSSSRWGSTWATCGSPTPTW